MSGAKVAPYGSWRSPITSELMGSIGYRDPTMVFGEIAFDNEDIYWTECRPREKGRFVVVRRAPDGTIGNITPLPFSARTAVHSGGGGAFAVSDGAVFFSNASDQRLYHQVPGAHPRAITPPADLRYADGVIDHRRNRMICVREDHTVGGREAVNTLVSVDLAMSDGGQLLVGGNDFYAYPRLSPDGSQLAWLTWHHPNMSWDETELWVGEIKSDGMVGRRELIAGGVGESILQPEWSPDGILYFIAEPTGWWNLYRWQDGRVEAVCEMEAEFGYPMWRFRQSNYAFESANCIVCTYTKESTWHLASLDTKTGELKTIETPYTEIWAVQARPGRAVVAAGSPTESPRIVEVDLRTGELEVLYRYRDVRIDAGYVSLPEIIEFPTERGLSAYGFYYPARNQDFVGPEGERPPLLVMSHGGPHASTSTTHRMDIQFWTSRGIAVLDVNYGGSTRYGREYRKRLDFQWGVVDVEDCINGAHYLVRRGDVDGDRLAIRGGSSGGTCTLCALTFHDVFQCGASYYGDSDFELSYKDTHKFEKHYIDSLVGPYPEKRDLWLERSPLYHTDQLSRPVIFFQGLDDKSITPPQTELMVKALREQGGAVAYIPFEGEGHGFLRAENVKRSFDAELYFYSRVLGFELADPVEPVEIENFE